MKGHTLLAQTIGELGESERRLLPRRWQILGDLVLVNIWPQIEHLKRQIGQGLLQLYPRCRSVLWDKGVYGRLRTPEVEVIAGGATETLHKENYCKFALDARLVMFSAGNFAERLRMAKIGAGEAVLDMFSGIGQLCIPMAVHARPSSIVAIELNPAAYHYLKQNIALNRVNEIIRPVCGDCAEIKSTHQFDRVIMGHFDARHYLQKAIQSLRCDGVLHYHEVVPSEAMRELPFTRVAETAGRLARSAELLQTRKVKDYAPGIIHVVTDAKIG